MRIRHLYANKKRYKPILAADIASSSMPSARYCSSSYGFRAVNVTGYVIFFTYTNGICHVFVVLVNILQLVIHDLLFSYPCASFATNPVSVSQLQTSLER